MNLQKIINIQIDTILYLNPASTHTDSIILAA